MSVLDEERIKYIKPLAVERLDALASTVVDTFRGLGPDARQSGDDSPYEDVWEELKEQVQNGESVLWEVYTATVRGYCDDVVQELSPFERQTLWFWTDAFSNWTGDGGEAPPFDPANVSREIYVRIMSRAYDEPLKDQAEEENNTDEYVEDDAEETGQAKPIAQGQLNLDW